MLVEGVFNAVRLKNKNKIIYIFFDIHNQKNKQTKCNDDNLVFSDYLVSQLKNNKDNIFDFFFETHSNFNINYSNLRYRDELHFILDHSKPNNMRYHKMDIRAIFYNGLNKFFVDLLNMYTFHNYDKLQMTINFISQVMKLMYDYILYILGDKQNFNIKSYNFNFDSNVFANYKKIIKKIINKYHNKELQIIMIKIIRLYLLPLFDDIIKLLKETYELSENINLTNQENIDIHIKYIFSLFIKIGSWIMDFYFVRRLFDKDYITNSIVYVGGEHATRYIYLLVKYFKFEITHCAKCNLSTDKLNKKIKNIDLYSGKYMQHNNLEQYFMSDLNQCVDMNMFPDNFM